MKAGIKSHPHLYLREHVEQVQKAMQVITEDHSDKVNALVKTIIERAAVLHDLGKITTAFQEYIKDPEHYSGDPDEKRHSHLSAFFALLLAMFNGWDDLDALALTAVVMGHHSRLPTVPEDCLSGCVNTGTDIDGFLGGEKARIVKNQLRSISFDTVGRELPNRLFAATATVNLAIEGRKIFREIRDYLRDNLIGRFHRLSLEEAVRFRVYVQLIYSVLLEADKAFLAVTNPSTYSEKRVNKWQLEWITGKIGQPERTLANDLRGRIRNELILSLMDNKDCKIFSLTAPTGSGKTLLAATWALKFKEILEFNGKQPKTIVVLPFLSVIDQTVNEYIELLKYGGIKTDGTWLLSYHSLADRSYSEDVGEDDTPFLVDTWRSDIIITTYDQFLMTLIDPKAKYQMRFHNLCDALIIFDEVQSLPCRLWRPLEKILNSLAEVGNSRILLMSATLPPFISEAVPLLKNYKAYFAEFKRYKVILRLKEPIKIEQFCEEVSERLKEWLTNKKRVMITMNTRKSARMVMKILEDSRPAGYSDIPFYFISADVTPRDRLEKIKRIKKGTPCIVVSTQCVEAGVDIDMDLVIRDFGPLDSIVQIAGRCNREGKLKGRGVIEIVDIVDEDNRRYSDMIYDDVHLNVTRKLLENITKTMEHGIVPEFLEEEVLDYTERYFEELTWSKDTGQIHLERFARWQDDISVRELLRGKEKYQYTFLVLEQDRSLKDAMDAVVRIDDRWQRREAWKKLAGRMAMVAVNIFATAGFHPCQIADEYVNQIYLLREGYYKSEYGLMVEGYTEIL